MKRGVPNSHSGVVFAAIELAQQEALFARFSRGKERLPRVALAVRQSLREGLVARLGQQENADDADESTAGEYDVVEEVALLIVQLHDGGGQHAEACAGQN